MEATILATPSAEDSASLYSTQDLHASVPTPFPRDLLPTPTYSQDTPTHSHPQLALNGSMADRDASEFSAQDPTAVEESTEAVPAAVRTETHGATPQIVSDVQPSLEDLRESCLTALLNLFPQPANDATLHPPSPASSRRHSVPVSPGVRSFNQASDELQPLQQLLQNLRMLDPLTTYDNQTPMHELARRLPAAVEATLQGLEAELAMVLASLLVHIQHLPPVPTPQPSPTRSKASSFRNSLPAPLRRGSEQDLYETLGRHVLSVKAQQLHKANSDQSLMPGSSESGTSQNLWEEINRDMETVLRLCRERTPAPSAESPATPDLASLEAPSGGNYFDNMPPEYDYQDYPQDLPMYEHRHGSLAKKMEKEMKRSMEREREVEPEPRFSSEKMRIDLEAITSAIDRLYLVAPQLHNQRVELDVRKLEQMESARRSGARLRGGASASQVAVEAETAKLVGRGRMTDQTATLSKRFSAEVFRLKPDLKGKGKARESDSSLDSKSKGEDLDRMLKLIGKSTGDQRRIVDQRVDFGDFQQRVQKVQLRDQKQKELLVDQLIRHSTAGRLSAQDAVFHRDVLRNSMRGNQEPEKMMSLPEFIRESVPQGSVSRTLNPHALLTLPEFFREQSDFLGQDPPPSRPQQRVSSEAVRTTVTTAPPTHNPVTLIRKMARSRSNSAPPVSWFKSGTALASKTTDGQKSARSSQQMVAKSNGVSASVTRRSSVEDGLSVLYVAEYHQNLHSVQVYLRTILRTPGLEVEMNVLPSKDGALMGSDKFVIRAGTIKSAPFELPVPVAMGPTNLKVFGEHFEVKLEVPPLAQIPVIDPSDIPRLLDAEQIKELAPSTFICSSCSLPVVQCGDGKVTEWLDLPSEHWAEMMDAWMCHPDQKLTQSMTQHSTGGFAAPTEGQAFVGGSYILFDGSSVVKETLSPAASEEQADRSSVRCRCGAIIGRSMQNKNNGVTYRLAKYALRPLSLTLDPLRIPLSAYVVADMVELQQAHATHRFVVTDDEEDKPRMLIWLFNPTVRMSYRSATHYALPEQSTLLAAKVFYTLIGPSSPLALDSSKINEQYPAFKSAETISYPMSICRRLAAMLKESTELYPQLRKTMMQLDVGWLQRG